MAPRREHIFFTIPVTMETIKMLVVNFYENWKEKRGDDFVEFGDCIFCTSFEVSCGIPESIEGQESLLETFSESYDEDEIYCKSCLELITRLKSEKHRKVV
jgi:hypothetical protein